MPDFDDVIREATESVDRFRAETKSLRDSLPDRIKSEVERQLSGKVDGQVSGVHDRIDQIETSLKRGGGPFSGKAETAEEREYKSAFDNYVRTGTGEDKLRGLQTKALSVGSDPDGGYFVTPALSQRVIEKVQEIAPIRQVALVETISTGELEIPVDTDTAEAEWVDETSERAETKTPKLGKKRIVVHELSASPLATQRLLEDAAFSVDTWLSGKLAQTFALKEGKAFVLGTGRGQPRGFLTYAPGVLPDFTPSRSETLQIVKTGAATGFPDGNGTADALLGVVYSLKAAYRANASWLMPRSLQLKIRTLKDDRGAYLWQPGLQLGQPDRLLGYPVYDAEDMPAMAAGSYSVAFGDWKAGYTIVDRIGIQILRDPYSKKPFVEFNARKRVGGDVVNFEALTLLKTSV